jgi:hypothetical protein
MVWTFAGCAISRFALLRLTREETLPIDEVFHFSRERWGVCLLAFAACFGVVALLCVPGFFIGLLLVNDWSAWLGGLLWIFVVGFSAAMAFLLFGLMFAWPLIVTSVAAENQNALDAVTRSLAYVFQRPLNYALYGLIALAFGGFCWLIVSQIAASTIQLAFWNGSWGASVYNENRMDEFIGTRSFELEPARASEAAAVTNPDERAFTLKAGANLIRFANGLVSTLAVAFMYGLFWTLSSGVYLLLRHDVDETEMDEVFIDEESRTYDLPPLKSDAYGIPQIQPLEEYQQTMENKNNERNNLDGLGE